MKVITVRDTPPYCHAHTYQISLTYLERQKCYGPDKIILFKKTIIWPWGQRSRSNEGHYGMRHTALWSCTHIPNIIDLSWKKQLFDLEVKGQGPTKVITVRDTPPYGHAPTYQISLTYLERQKSYGPDKLRWEEEEEEISIKQYVSLRSKGRHNNMTNVHSRVLPQ